MTAKIPNFSTLALLALFFSQACAAAPAQDWARGVLDFPYAPPQIPHAILQVVRQDFGNIRINKSVLNTDLEIAGVKYEYGIGAWAESLLRIYSPKPIVGFESFVGVDSGPKHLKGRGNVNFKVVAGGKEIYASGAITGRDAAEKCSLTFNAAHLLELHAINAGENPVMNHANWAEARVIFADGDSMRLDKMRRGDIPHRPSRHPFSFTYDGKSSDELLADAEPSVCTEKTDGFEYITTTWTLPCGLCLILESKQYADFPAVEWMLRFENTANKPTPIIENIQSMDLVLDVPITGPRKNGAYTTAVKDYYRLHRTEGDSGSHNPGHFLSETVEIDYQKTAAMSAEAGRSSQKTLPFYKIDTGDGALIVAIGWSGQWKSTLETPDGRHLRMCAGLETTHFKLLPGEKIRLPRMLAMRWIGDSWDANAQFRKLIHKHYAATLDGRKPEPSVWANTWCIGRTDLNKATAADHIEMLQMYSRLKGVTCFITDAGWYKGGFGTGDGDYVPNEANWPGGIAPVAAAARVADIGYGLWFDVEKVFGGTDYAVAHPDWLLSPYAPDATEVTVADEWGSDFKKLRANELKKFIPYLRDLGNPKALDDLYKTVSHYLRMSGMQAYRQDFNYNPLKNWQLNDKPDRRGMTEIKYIMGLYDFWDRLALEFPGVLRDECSSGGRRIDLETIMRMHVHQKSDLSRHPEADQSAVWGLSQYLPNNVFSTISQIMTDYDMLSTIPASIALGWKVYEKDFDSAKAQKFLDLHARIRPLLVDSWYPLTKPNLDETHWIASQYHRTDLNQGMIVAYRRANCVYAMMDVSLREIDPAATYELEYMLAGRKESVPGGKLCEGFGVAIPAKKSAELIIYKKL